MIREWLLQLVPQRRGLEALLQGPVVGGRWAVGQDLMRGESPLLVQLARDRGGVLEPAALLP